MRIRYTIKSDERDPSLRAFEEVMGFVQGFRQVEVPASIGEGRLTALEIDTDFHINMHFCKLRSALEIKKEWQGDATDHISLAFYDLQAPQRIWIRGDEVVYDQEGVNIYTGGVDMTLLIPAHTERNAVCVRITRQKLESMLGTTDRQYLSELLQEGQAFFLHEPLTPAMRAVIQELKLSKTARPLEQLLYRARTMELIYLLLEQLNKRTGAPCKTSDPVHIARIFQAKALLVADLSEPPTIAGLAARVLLSESQLKQSFREIFGMSIYQYFQQERLVKAKQLLAENTRTVKEVGYELGFTNIGHFSRLFEREFHVKPKKFQTERRIRHFL